MKRTRPRRIGLSTLGDRLTTPLIDQLLEHDFRCPAAGTLYWPWADLLVVALDEEAVAQASLFSTEPVDDLVLAALGRSGAGRLAYLYWGDAETFPHRLMDLSADTTLIARFGAMAEFSVGRVALAVQPAHDPRKQTISLTGQKPEGSENGWISGSVLYLPLLAGTTGPELPAAFTAISLSPA